MISFYVVLSILKRLFGTTESVSEIVTENHRLGCKCTARFVCKQRKLQRRKCVKSYKKGSRLIAALVLLPQSFTCFKPLGFQISVTLDRMGGDSLEYVVFQKSVVFNSFAPGISSHGYLKDIL